jgi:hypothetical protein
MIRPPTRETTLTALDDDDWPDEADSESAAEPVNPTALAHRIAAAMEMMGLTPAAATQRFGVALLVLDRINLGLVDGLAVADLELVLARVTACA